MPIKPPAGCLTRPEAAKLFNRSQRALERDLNLALSMQDADVLDHWRLVTKDGEVRQAADVVTNDVKQLVTDGMTPTWYIKEEWLEQEYGRKGTPKPSKSQESSGPSHHSTQQAEDSGSSSDTTPIPTIEPPLHGDIAFLHERIRTLEREKKDEAQRSDSREAKLFEQLAVKDRQISAWDEVTQGLTRGLATGQLVPSLLTGPSPTTPARSVANPTDSPSQSVQDATVVKDSSPASRKKSPAKKRSKSKPKQKRPKTAFEKHTPTFHKLASGLFRHS
ncbi:MAG: hypothetical protein HOH82_09760 [Planctomycetaceae bacterium]|jgi:hypothetical protein|nr:hypothetical protein [Planctomycetaceae bacterium]